MRCITGCRRRSDHRSSSHTRRNSPGRRANKLKTCVGAAAKQFAAREKHWRADWRLASTFLSSFASPHRIPGKRHRTLRPGNEAGRGGVRRVGEAQAVVGIGHGRPFSDRDDEAVVSSTQSLFANELIEYAETRRHQPVVGTNFVQPVVAGSDASRHPL